MAICRFAKTFITENKWENEEIWKIKIYQGKKPENVFLMIIKRRSGEKGLFIFSAQNVSLHHHQLSEKLQYMSL